MGGSREFEKPIGFGYDGLSEYVSFRESENEEKQIVSSENNIGTATITFKGSINDNNLDKTIETNVETGEYRVELIPYQYSILANGISIASNTNISLLNATETLDLREVNALERSEFTALDNTTRLSEPYHYTKSFKYNAPVTLTFLSQTSRSDIEFDGVSYSLSDLAVPIYEQGIRYEVKFSVSVALRREMFVFDAMLIPLARMLY